MLINIKIIDTFETQFVCTFLVHWGTSLKFLLNHSGSPRSDES